MDNFVSFAYISKNVMNNSVPFDKTEVGVIWILAFWTIGKKPVFVVDYFPYCVKKPAPVANFDCIFCGASTRLDLTTSMSAKVRLRPDFYYLIIMQSVSGG